MGIGTAINVVAVLVGGGIGTLAGARLPDGMSATAMQAIGIVTLLVGVSNFLKLATTSTQKLPTLTLVKVQEALIGGGTALLVNALIPVNAERMVEEAAHPVFD